MHERWHLHLLPVALAIVAGACAVDESPNVLANRQAAERPAGAGANSAGAATPAPSAPPAIGGGLSVTDSSAPPSSNSVAPTAAPTAAPLASVASVSVSPVTFVTLYPPPSDLKQSLGLPTQQQFMAAVTLSNGSTGGFRWVDKSGGKLNVTPSGLVSTRTDTPAGLYEVDLQSADDANRFVAITVQVLASTELDLTVN